MNIISNLKNYLDNSENYMSSMTRKAIIDKDYNNILESLSSGSLREMNFFLKFKYIFIKYLQKKIWGKDFFDSTYFKHYENLCKKQNRLVDFDIIKHAFTFKILNENNLLQKKICSIGDGKANFIMGCLTLKKDLTLYSINLPQSLIQDYLILKKYKILDDQYIKVVNEPKDLLTNNIKLFLIPVQNKDFLKNQNINLFTNIACFQEIPKKETDSYFEIIKNNNSYFYCCNNESKTMYDGVINNYYEYPWGECEKIFEEECYFYQKYYSLRPPFIRNKKGPIIHSLVKYNN